MRLCAKGKLFGWEGDDHDAFGGSDRDAKSAVDAVSLVNHLRLSDISAVRAVLSLDSTACVGVASVDVERREEFLAIHVFLRETS